MIEDQPYHEAFDYFLARESSFDLPDRSKLRRLSDEDYGTFSNKMTLAVSALGEFLDHETPDTLQVRAYLEAAPDLHEARMIVRGDDKNHGESHLIGTKDIPHEDLETVTFFDDESLDGLLSYWDKSLDAFLNDHPDINLLGVLSDDQIQTIREEAKTAIKKDVNNLSYDGLAEMAVEGSGIQYQLDLISSDPEIQEQTLGFDPTTGESVESVESTARVSPGT